MHKVNMSQACPSVPFIYLPSPLPEVNRVLLISFAFPWGGEATALSFRLLVKARLIIVKRGKKNFLITHLQTELHSQGPFSLLGR